MKILILKRDKLGDLLLTTPLFEVLRQRFPDARIDLLASDYNAWVAHGNPHLDQILSYPRVRTGRRVLPAAVWTQAQLFFSLRKKRYDVVIVAQGEHSPRAVQRALWTGAARVISYVNPDSPHPRKLSDPLPAPAVGHEAERLLGLLRPLGITPGEILGAPLFVLPDSAARFASTWLAQSKLVQGQFVVLGLGARRARKQPTTDQILRWVTRLKAEKGLDTVFMWTPGDKANPLYPGDDAIARPVLEASPPGLVPFRGPLLPALGLIWQARTSIFPDSGLMHFASASPNGVLGLFGDDLPFARKWAPLGPRSTYLVAPEVALLDDELVFTRLTALCEGQADRERAST